MYPSLLFSRQLAAGITVFSLTVGLLLPPLQAVAHYGCEGTGGAAVTTVTAASTGVLQGHASHASASDSLWGNLLLSMAYQRDPEIQKYAKRLGRANTLTWLSIAGISGLGLAQSITGLNSTHGAETYHVVDHGQGAHIHTEGESRLSSKLGIIGSGATIATLGIKALLDRKYSHRIDDRQQIIKEKVEHILAMFEAGERIAEAQAELTQLVGERAALEFVQLWQSTHRP